MKSIKLEILVIDFDGLGESSIKDMIENQRYPNYCISPKVMGASSVDIGEWHDSHPLNLSVKMVEEYKRLFHIEAVQGEGEVTKKEFVRELENFSDDHVVICQDDIGG